MASTPSNRQQHTQQTFFKLTPEIAVKLRAANLTASEWRLWSFLATLDPFGSRYLEVPDYLSLLEECQISKATYYRALARFQDAGLFDVQPVQTLFRNLLGTKFNLSENSLKNETEVSQMRIESQERESSLKSETEFSSVRLDSQNCENRPLEPNQGNTSDPSKIYLDSLDDLRSLSEAETREREALALDHELRKWLTEKALKLPQPPEFLDQWLDSQVKIESNLKAFKKSQNSFEAPPVPPAPPDRFALEQSCDAAAKMGDREFLLGKLRSVWNDGFHSLVEEVCLAYPSWGVCVTQEGVKGTRKK